MRKSQRSTIFDISVFVCSIVVLGYFGWHGFYGPRSFEHKAQVLQQVSKAKKELAMLEAERESRNARIALLRPRSIDPDMLDQMARKTLGYANSSDLIYFQNAK